VVHLLAGFEHPREVIGEILRGAEVHGNAVDGGGAGVEPEELHANRLQCRYHIPQAILGGGAGDLQLRREGFATVEIFRRFARPGDPSNEHQQNADQRESNGQEDVRGAHPGPLAGTVMCPCSFAKLFFHGAAGRGKMVEALLSLTTRKSGC
jgi:hypothetical protein